MTVHFTRCNEFGLEINEVLVLLMTLSLSCSINFSVHILSMLSMFLSNSFIPHGTQPIQFRLMDKV